MLAIHVILITKAEGLSPQELHRIGSVSSHSHQILPSLPIGLYLRHFPEQSE
jgi:hypothetical protein